MNAVVCMAICLRLLFFCGPHRYGPGLRWVRYGIVLATAWVALKIWHCDYVTVGYGELALNLVLCDTVWQAHGDISKITGDIS
ncbi:phage holin family protein [Hafnia alvei]|uniref:phage holin family protein n=1 Tax=Hafnia alvei TaxID=569 RepID=UPI00242E15D3|nr:phage holin family protein [Hafnia alvei]